MGAYLKSFSESVQVSIKHVERTRDGLWGQSQYLNSSRMLQLVSEQTSHSTMWFEDEPSESWWVCNARG